jgi:peptide/nickel transport system permease protein
MTASIGLGSVRSLVRRDKLAAIGLVITAAFFIIPLALVVTNYAILPYSPTGIDLNSRMQAPSLAHLLGTDALGRDVLSRLLAATVFDAPIPLLVVALSLVLGGALGVVAGYFGGWADQAMMRITDIFLAFPGLVLAMAIAAALGPGLLTSTYALLVTWWPKYARLARGEVLRIREAQFVEASKASGSSSLHIIVRHIVPNMISPLLAYITLDVGNILLLFSVLSYIGLGVQPPSPEWGGMVNSGQDYIQRAPWLALAPGLAIVIVVISFSLVGDAVRDMLDPKSKKF